MKEIQAFVEPSRLYDVVAALQRIPGMSAIVMSEVRLFPSTSSDPSAMGRAMDPTKSLDGLMIVCVVPESLAPSVVEAIERAYGDSQSEHERIVIHAVDQPGEAGTTPEGKTTS